MLPLVFNVCFSYSCSQHKLHYLKKKKLTKQRYYEGCQKASLTFYILRYSLLIILLILVFSKTKHTKVTIMSYGNIKNKFFSQQASWRYQNGFFLRCQLSCFAPINILLHSYDLFFRLILLLP